ncbi:MAG: hypothetical protein AUK47_03965 [Deltaproteobacteria bacterium CG2_30_63_29]|nr:MAG: hypothetical protein AUK47_03965 [Deltaproteobacteria bacterium CG2_30_63_29]PIW01622.1 MAG: hypothetical protein COW42_04350 [Deltaproteobacteria bacterium CG17_big_fil_post_rev_8_21_14_2_50_63_7]PJB46848.1 MAG: hypothetical protein CO108_04975 [Deltaproteobacteria bacterium CG_4_9_14_3_um_filter_63_12]
MRFIAILAALLASFLVFGSGATANERHFTYTYETGTLPPGALEFEPSLTFRTEKDAFYNRMDTRLEFEFGVTDSVQSALYFNLSAESQRIDESIVNVWKMPSVSNEWKFKVLDPLADALGLGLYLEVTGAPHELELEGKLLADKHLGPILVAFNAVFESESKVEPEELETEFALEFDLGVAWLLHENFSLGLEVRNKSVMDADGELAHSALFAGLTASFSAERYWVSLTALPQVFGIKGNVGGDSLNLSEFTMVESRLLFGFHL